MFPGIRAGNRLVADHAFASKSAGSGGSSVSRIPVFRPPGKPQPPGQVLVAPLELRRGELVKVVGFALQAAAAETERVAAKVQEGQTTH